MPYQNQTIYRVRWKRHHWRQNKAELFSRRAGADRKVAQINENRQAVSALEFVEMHVGSIRWDPVDTVSQVAAPAHAGRIEQPRGGSTTPKDAVFVEPVGWVLPFHPAHPNYDPDWRET